MDGGDCQATVHRVAQSWTWLSDWTELNWTEHCFCFPGTGQLRAPQGAPCPHPTSPLRGPGTPCTLSTAQPSSRTKPHLANHQASGVVSELTITAPGRVFLLVSEQLPRTFQEMIYLFSEVVYIRALCSLQILCLPWKTCHHLWSERSLLAWRKELHIYIYIYIYIFFFPHSE